MPADGVVPVSGTERGHDTRPGENRYAEFRRVMAFLEANDVRLVRGYGRDEDSIHFGGHRIRHLHDRYAEVLPDVSR